MPHDSPTPGQIAVPITGPAVNLTDPCDEPQPCPEVPGCPSDVVASLVVQLQRAREDLALTRAALDSQVQLNIHLERSNDQVFDRLVRLISTVRKVAVQAREQAVERGRPHGYDPDCRCGVCVLDKMLGEPGMVRP